jgi:dienelactone hydrolase
MPMSTQESYPSAAGPIPVEVFDPPGTGDHPAVVVVYGTEGMNEPFGPLIRNFAKSLAAAGMVALIPDYLRSTATAAGTASVWEALDTSRDAWVGSIADAARFADGRGGVKKGKFGLVGFSLGGNLALRLAKSPGAVPRALAVIDFFAPISEAGGIGPGVTNLPPLQIHHGAADIIVPTSQSAELMRLLDEAHKTKGTDYFYFEYPGEGHGFKDASAINDSTARATDFLRNNLA